MSAKRGEERYRSPKLGRMATMIFRALSGRSATTAAAPDSYSENSGASAWYASTAARSGASAYVYNSTAAAPW